MRGATDSPQTNPFPGLRPFKEEEDHLLFGWENQVDAMVNRLADISRRSHHRCAVRWLSHSSPNGHGHA